MHHSPIPCKSRAAGTGPRGCPDRDRVGKTLGGRMGDPEEKGAEPGPDFAQRSESCTPSPRGGTKRSVRMGAFRRFRSSRSAAMSKRREICQA